LASRRHEEIEFDWIEGAKLAVRRGMAGATGNIYCGLHEFVQMAFLLHLLRPNDLFLDVGANIGSYTVLAAKVCQARAIAFEPDPETAKALFRNVSLNGIDRSVTVWNVAVGDFDGEIRFTSGLDTTNRVARAEDSAVRNVPIWRLDNLCGEISPVLLKMDVEGFEERVLAGAGRVLGSPTLIAITSEAHTARIEELLASYGFAPMFYDPHTRSLRKFTYDYAQSNTLFVREPDRVARLVASAPVRTVAGVTI